MIRRIVIVAAVGLASTATRADDAPPAKPPVPPTAAPAVPAPPVTAEKPAPAPAGKPTPPPTPEQAADAVLAAAKAKDGAALKALAAKDDPDPWLVADELIRRGELDSADAFATAAPRMDVERLPAYVKSRRGEPDDAAARRSLAAANAALVAGSPKDAIEALGSPDDGKPIDAVGIRRAFGRGQALSGLGRPEESATAFLAAADAAERLGWLAMASDAYGASADADHGGSFELIRETWERKLAVCNRRSDVAGSADAWLGVCNAWWSMKNYAMALSACEHGLAAWESLGDTRSAASALVGIGDLQEKMGQHEKALSTLERALALTRSLGEQRRVASTLVSIGKVRDALGEHARALSTFEEARSIMQTLGDRKGEGWVLQHIRHSQKDAGQNLILPSTYEKLLAAIQASGDMQGLAHTLCDLGRAYLTIGESAKALSTFERALAVTESSGDVFNAPRLVAAIGEVHAHLGDYAKALVAFERALAAFEAPGRGLDEDDAATTRTRIGRVYELLGDHERALGLLDRALSAQVALGDREGAVETMQLLARTQQAMGNHTEALSTLEHALLAEEELGDKELMAELMAKTLGRMAGVHRAAGDPARALSSLERALAIQRASGDDEGSAISAHNIGAAYEAMGDHAKALSTLERAFVAFESMGMREWSALTQSRVGSVHYRLGDYTKAITFQHRAALATAVLARGLGAEEGVSARRRVAFIFDDGVRAALAAGNAAELAFFLETGRAGALMEGLRTREALWSAVVPEELRAEEARARVAEAAATRALRRALDAGSRVEAQARRSEVEAARDQVSTAIARIQRRAKEGAALVYPEVATLDEVQATLRKGDVLVLYGLLKEEVIALVETSADARIVTLGSRLPIERAASALSRLNESEITTDDLAMFARLLIAPLGLPPTTRRVLVSPVGVLNYVPFAAIVSDATVTYVPSGTTYRMLLEDGDRHGDAVLSLGDPDYQTRVDETAVAVVRGGLRLSQLPATREEAQELGTQALLGAEASEAGFRNAVVNRARWRAVHFACHGLVDPERPALSSLALTASGNDDGFLTSLDVFRMKIPADLVVLSACETGKGKIIEGEGIVGLTRAFMFAGAPRVICSLWKVDDEATKALMVEVLRVVESEGRLEADGDRGGVEGRAGVREVAGEVEAPVLLGGVGAVGATVMMRHIVIRGLSTGLRELSPPLQSIVAPPLDRPDGIETDPPA